MKNQRYLTKWAAPRYGFTNVDWGALWFDALSSAGLPGPDFIIWNPSKHLEKFCSTIADYSGTQRAMRHLLQRPPFSLQPDAAKQFTLHGFRHIYTTAMRQMSFATDAINDAGHWRVGSEMPRIYDASEATNELVAKDKVRCAVALGWRRAAPGTIPLPPPLPLASPSTPGPVLFAPTIAPQTPPRDWQAEPGAASSSSSSCPPVVQPVRVVNFATQILHNWVPTSTNGKLNKYTMCRKMLCGTPLAPTRRAVFEGQEKFETKHFDLCKACFEA